MVELNLGKEWRGGRAQRRTPDQSPSRPLHAPDRPSCHTVSGHRWRAAVAAKATRIARRRGAFGWISHEASRNCGQVEQWRVLNRRRKSPPSLRRSTPPILAHVPNHLALGRARPVVQDRDGNNRPAIWRSSRSSTTELLPRSSTVWYCHSLKQRLVQRTCPESNHWEQTPRR